MPAPPLGVDERRPKPVDPKAATPEIDLGSPPASPAPDVETPSGNPLANPTELTPPVAPVDPAPKNPPGTVYQRDAFRPVFTAVNATTYLRSSRDGSLHVLEGKVVSSLTHEAESGVRVTVSNRRQTFADRVAVTDGNGRYKVRLPDGDWTVSVTTKSGKVYPVSELIVDKGQISDDAGETIPSLTITR